MTYKGRRVGVFSVPDVGRGEWLWGFLRDCRLIGHRRAVNYCGEHYLVECPRFEVVRDDDKVPVYHVHSVNGVVNVRKSDDYATQSEALTR